ncbi:nephronectin isoform X3 [Alligator sinensis]|uniref:Nephronectin isoform X3 n=1 Tax=Alligator sinensis TaxID=38654 RepID=A0A3Q0GYM8_ALLSI|nr:nephronectin isoform X3 [Alligator sinensis]
MASLLGVALLCCLPPAAAGELDGRWRRQIVSSTGLCRFGSRIDCCWGWARHSWGQCQPFYVLRQRIARLRCQLKAICQPRCKHGECVGSNKCKCHPGYTGKTCNQDLNECGLKPRPCKHRCMNTYGSYKCYCLNGYMLMPDGTCSNALSCSMANCQYGCDVVKGEVRCRCPSPGLQLGPDGRTCVDVDECATGRVICPRFRKCVNTFGSYICKCHKGFDLMYIGGKYQCHDIDECSIGQYQCGGFSRCYNTQGSYKCKCKEGYRGDGTNCILIPKVMIEPSSPYNIFKGNSTRLKGSSGMTNRVPDNGSTRQPLRPPHIPAVITARPAPKPTVRPTPKPTTRFAPKQVTTRPVLKPATRPPPPPQPTTSVSTPPPERTPGLTMKDPSLVLAEATSTPGITVDNRIQIDPQKPRGDVFIPRQPGVSNNLFEIFEIEKGISADEYEANDDPGRLLTNTSRGFWRPKLLCVFPKCLLEEAPPRPGILVHSCNFDSGLCGWIKDKDDDLHWEPVANPSELRRPEKKKYWRSLGRFDWGVTTRLLGLKPRGGRYLTVSESKDKEGRVARLVLSLGQLAHSGDLCLSFRHKVSGLHPGALQVFVRKNGTHGPAVWGRSGGHGWKQTHLTLHGSGLKSVIFKGEKGKGRTGDIGLDDVSLKKGHCSERH